MLEATTEDSGIIKNTAEREQALLSTASVPLIKADESNNASVLKCPSKHQIEKASELTLKLAVSSISLQLALESLEKTTNKLYELSLNHSVQSRVNATERLLKRFTAYPDIETWQALGKAIKQLIDCCPAESNSLLKQYELLSKHYDHFFNLEQIGTEPTSVVECYKGYVLSDNSLFSPNIAYPPCLIHSVISRTFSLCSQYLNAIVDDRLKASDIEYLIDDREKSNFYQSLCGSNSLMNGFSMHLNDTQVRDKCTITMKWRIPEDLFDDTLAHKERLSSVIKKLNCALRCLDVNLDATFRGPCLAVDVSFPAIRSKRDNIFTPSSPAKIDLYKNLQFNFNGISVLTTQDIFKNHIDEVGEAIKIAQSFKNRFSNKTSKLYFFTISNSQEPFVQLNCAPLKVSLPLKTFCNPEAFTSSESCELNLKTLEQKFMKTSFAQAIHNIDNAVTIKELTLGYNTLSDDAKAISITDALSAFANAARKEFPNEGLTLYCKRNSSGKIYAEIDFAKDELHTLSEDELFIPGYAFYDSHGFFRGVLESRQTVKKLKKYLRSFAPSESISEIAKKIVNDTRNDKGIELKVPSVANVDSDQGGIEKSQATPQETSPLHFDSKFLSAYGNLTNSELIHLILTNSIEWCFSNGEFFIGRGKAFIPKSWYSL